jgi:hypothetical protein
LTIQAVDRQGVGGVSWNYHGQLSLCNDLENNRVFPNPIFQKAIPGLFSVLCKIVVLKMVAI